jgi:dTDP-4-amino-4,6-dideoxygalactose transaminase
VKIPFHRPFYDRRDEEALLGALRTGRIVGDGDRTRAAAQQFATLLGTRHVLLTTSCTHALELAMMVLRLKPGDEVIVPSFTFVSTTNCILRAGGQSSLPTFSPTLSQSIRQKSRNGSLRTPVRFFLLSMQA